MTQSVWCGTLGFTAFSALSRGAKTRVVLSVSLATRDRNRQF